MRNSTDRCVLAWWRPNSELLRRRYLTASEFKPPRWRRRVKRRTQPSKPSKSSTSLCSTRCPRPRTTRRSTYRCSSRRCCPWKRCVCVDMERIEKRLNPQPLLSFSLSLSLPLQPPLTSLDHTHSPPLHDSSRRRWDPSPRRTAMQIIANRFGTG